MNNVELAKKALKNIDDRYFKFRACASEGGKCGDSWSDVGELDVSASELLYAIIGEDKELLPDGMEVTEFNYEEALYDEAFAMAWPDGENEDTERWYTWGECESMENYINGWNSLLDEINDGTITDENLEDMICYFEDEAYDDCTYEEWKEDSDEFEDEE